MLRSCFEAGFKHAPLFPSSNANWVVPQAGCLADSKILHNIGNRNYLIVQRGLPKQHCGFVCQRSAFAVFERTGPADNPVYDPVFWGETSDAGYFKPLEIVNYNNGKNTFLKISECMDGTGGCGDHVLVYTEDKGFIPLEQDESLLKTLKNLPEEYQLAKSPGPNLKSLRWCQAISKPDDPNCCASKYIDMGLEIKDNTLAVRSASIKDFNELPEDCAAE